MPRPIVGWGWRAPARRVSRESAVPTPVERARHFHCSRRRTNCLPECRAIPPASLVDGGDRHFRLRTPRCANNALVDPGQWLPGTGMPPCGLAAVRGVG